MCTSIYDNRFGAYLGRTLDVEAEYGQRAVNVPRGTAFSTVYLGKLKYKYAAVGSAVIQGGVPLFFDGMNSEGLAACALHFGKSCKYFTYSKGKLNLASFEVIPYALSQFRTVGEVVRAFEKLNITEGSFGTLPPTPLHWIIADKERAITVESTENGLRIYENTLGVLTNAPEFSYHVTRSCDIMGLVSTPPRDNMCAGALFTYSGGMGAIGLPGDYSSPSRFLRALYNKSTSLDFGVSALRMLHLFDTVAVPYGAVIKDGGGITYTSYTSVMDLNTGIYYFTTYNNRSIRAIKLDKIGKCKELLSFSMSGEQRAELLN